MTRASKHPIVINYFFNYILLTIFFHNLLKGVEYAGDYTDSDENEDEDDGARVMQGRQHEEDENTVWKFWKNAWKFYFNDKIIFTIL